jgi:diguanylate cyclase (GGDEF)-like protein
MELNMELQAKEQSSAVRQLPKLKSLLRKYRHVKTMQASLLQLSELASKVTELSAFYPAFDQLMQNLLVADNFFIVLTDQQQELCLDYCQQRTEHQLLSQLNPQQWLSSLAGLVFRNQQPLHCQANQHRNYLSTQQLSDYSQACIDWLGMPLKRGNQTIGVLALQSFTPEQQFDQQDADLLAVLAEHLVTAIDRVQSRALLEQSILHRTQKLTHTNHLLQQEIAERQKIEKMQQSMLAIAEFSASSQDVDSFYQAIHQEINKLIRADNLFVALLSKNQRQLEFPYYCDEYFPNPIERNLTHGLTELVITQAKPLLIIKQQMYVLQNNGVICEHTLPSPQRHTRKSQAWLATPLLSYGEVIGVLAVQDYHDAAIYQQADLSLLRFVGQHVAVAIERKQEQLARQQHQDELERLVSERTHALQASNLDLRRQIEEKRKIEQRLYHDAHHDVLTQLPNRAMLSTRLEQALRHLKRYPMHRFSLLFIDLDRFKIINDTLGHQAGDKFLIEVAARLKQCIRDNDMLARLGGDEFVILLDALENQEDIEEIAGRIINSIEQPFEFEGNLLHSSASIGITLCDNQYQVASDLLRDADAAMYQAKSLGRGRYMFFDVSMREQLIASLTLEQELRIAIKEQQFELHYQQISDLMSTNVIGFEALLRWRHPEKGLLTPSEFLFMAEETGMILEIETWVVEQVCQQIRYWQHSAKQTHSNAFISINLSGQQLTRANQLQALISLLKQQDIELAKLILEFDEAAFSQHAELALKGLNKLKQLGVKLALDDYGAGISSFNFIHSYPFEFIKLDRSFIRAINSSDKNLSLIKALQSLGEQFGYRLVAEGIESQEMLQKVQAAGCEFGQGYFLNKPELMNNPLESLKQNIASCA